VIGSFAEAKCKQVEKTPQAERRALRSARPKVLMHTHLRKTAKHQAQGCNGHLAFRTPSHRRVGMQQTTAPPRRKQQGR